MVTEEALRMLASGELADVRFTDDDETEANPARVERPEGSL